ncbi:PE family protein [Mycobacterium asiaticum]|uniref:PE domain-containing protein n=1 Tax=Mycobacterium asiaticum TaxID=1790 RepID=A0A1A3CP05_MYCAS|nr:PE family protein [Mycobacterium asiaticum]OBI88087.1 hypothetical protein A9X01_15635 [Mycobacterium asiaticum]
MQAAGPTQALLPAAADEVSTSITQLFTLHAEEFQVVAAQASAYHDQFVEKMKSAVGSYAGAEALNVSSLWEILVPIAIRGLDGGVVSYLNLLTWVSMLPQPFSQILSTLITIPVLLFVLLPLAFLAAVALVLAFAVLAEHGVSIFPPYSV